MKALVTGGNGFIGSNLVDMLAEQGHEVVVLDRFPRRFSQLHPKATHLIGDIGNHGQVLSALEGVDCVFHLACTTIPKTSNEDPVYDIRSNALDSVQLLTECTRAGVKKVVFLSSGGTVYGIPSSVPISEDHPTNPICSYGVTKLAVEKYLHLFHYQWGLEYVVVRYSNPYGPQQDPKAKHGAVGIFMGSIVEGRPITIFGDGEIVRDYVYVRDAVDALLKAADYQPAADDPRTFNIGYGTGHSLNELVEEMKAVVDRPVKVDYAPGVSADAPVNILDISRAKSVLGWEPTVSLREGLSHSWHWVSKLNSLGVACDPVRN